MPTIAEHCVRVRVKLGSARRRLRATSSFANHIRDWDILGSLDTWVGWAAGCPQPGKLPFGVIRHHLHYTGGAPSITAVTRGSTSRAPRGRGSRPPGHLGMPVGAASDTRPSARRWRRANAGLGRRSRRASGRRRGRSGPTDPRPRAWTRRPTPVRGQRIRNARPKRSASLV